MGTGRNFLLSFCSFKCCGCFFFNKRKHTKRSWQDQNNAKPYGYVDSAYLDISAIFGIIYRIQRCIFGGNHHLGDQYNSHLYRNAYDPSKLNKGDAKTAGCIPANGHTVFSIVIYTCKYYSDCDYNNFKYSNLFYSCGAMDAYGT